MNNQDIKEITERSKAAEQTGSYLIEFETNFAALINKIERAVNNRFQSLLISQRVARRYEKKRRLQKAKEIEEKIKIFGHKVITKINVKNEMDNQIDMTEKKIRHRV